MKILWITNIVFPEAQKLLTGSGSLKSSGGWLIGAAESLVTQPNVDLVVGALSPLVKKLTKLEGERITYYILPFGKGNTRVNHDYEPLWKQIEEAVKPDVVHLHGTEFTHGLAYLEACGSERVCVSIQGLISAISDYYSGGLSKREMLYSITPYSVLFGGIQTMGRGFVERAKTEKEIISRVGHILGRTSWDKARTWAINPHAQYHHVGESLQQKFYEGQTWDYGKCKSHSIFLSQAGSPIKGMHMVLRAMPYIIKQFPDTSIRVAGYDVCTCKGLRDYLRISHYGNILRRTIKKYNLGERIVFTGPLDAEGMRREYLNANIFICPSAIENSPNSLAEAQMLGVPVLASYVGGIPDMMVGDESHLYRFDEIEVLANKVCQVFKEEGKQEYLGAMRTHALRRHSQSDNTKELLNIYNEIKTTQ